MLTSDRSSGSEVDVLIVGAGMAGGAIAKSLADRGVSVVCLEQGPELHPAELPHFKESWELDKTRSFSPQPNIRARPEDYPVAGKPSTNVRIVNAVGGSANNYSGVFPRQKPTDFRKGIEHGLAPNWPISYEDLAPFYEINDAELGIAGLNGDSSYPIRSPRQTPPIPLGTYGRTLASGFEKLGWHWWPTDNAIITAPYDDRLPCNNCGQCVLGCPRGSMGTTAQTYWPKAVARGAKLRTSCRAERIVTKGGRAVGVVYRDLVSGARYQQNARAVVVCCNGIGTPRLLMLSATDASPHGLSNANGVLGKYLMLHPQAFVEGIFETPMDSYKGARGSPIFSHQFYETDVSRGFVNGFMLEYVRAPGAGYAATGYATFGPIPWGRPHHAEFKRMFNHHAWMLVMGEDLPLERNTVTLDPVLKDSSGLAAPRVTYRMHDQDRDLTRFAIDRAREALQAAGAYQISHSGVLDQPPGFHLMGTARMGDDPRDSATNKWHRSWEVPNLFICDGSSMPTSSPANPTSTIGALAVRLGEHLASNARDVLDVKKTMPDY